LGEQPPVREFDPEAGDDSAAHRRDAAFAVRLGLAEVRGIGREVAGRIVAARAQGVFTSMEDLVRRTGLAVEQLESLATAGAFDCLGLSRRSAVWQAGRAALNQPESLPGTLIEIQPVLFGEPTPTEALANELWATGVSTAEHPIGQLRADLQARGVLSSADLRFAEPDRRIEVGGLVTHRQRPATASGITFLSLEDEFGLLNVICSMGVWQRYRRVARTSSAVVVRGKLERSPEGVVNVLADRLEALPILVPHRSRDFH
jgi:error-prone DNA polymerase